jgi:peptidoglycan hydrolase CwlO-like protein
MTDQTIAIVLSFITLTAWIALLYLKVMCLRDEVDKTKYELNRLRDEQKEFKSSIWRILKKILGYD